MLGMGVIVVGAVMQFTGRINFTQFVLYVIAGVAFLVYTPILLKIRAKKQMKVNPEYRDPREYIFSRRRGSAWCRASRRQSMTGAGSSAR